MIRAWTLNSKPKPSLIFILMACRSYYSEYIEYTRVEEYKMFSLNRGKQISSASEKVFVIKWLMNKVKALKLLKSYVVIIFSAFAHKTYSRRWLIVMAIPSLEPFEKIPMK